MEAGSGFAGQCNRGRYGFQLLWDNGWLPPEWVWSCSTYPYYAPNYAPIAIQGCSATFQLHFESCESRRTAAQTIPTFRSISLITVSSLPLSTCLAKLRVNPLTVWKGECDGMASAKGSTTASTTTGPSLYARASARPSRTSPGSSIRIPFAPIASATLAKFGFLNSTPNGMKPASCCSI